MILFAVLPDSCNWFFFKTSSSKHSLVADRYVVILSKLVSECECFSCSSDAVCKLIFYTIISIKYRVQKSQQNIVLFSPSYLRGFQPNERANNVF